MKSFILFVCVSTVRIFFRRIGVQGLENVPADTPLLVVANHPNGLMDPVVLRIALERELGFLAKSTLFGNPFGKTAMEAFGAVPVYRAKDGNDTSKNDVMFDVCRDRLGEERSIVIFPEGVSHSAPQLLELKTGAARIALHAMDAGGRAAEVKILPVGLLYEAKDIFRSRVAVAVGEPIDPKEWHAREDRWQATTELTHAISNRLGDVVLQADSTELWSTLVVMAQWTHADAAEDIAVARERAHRMAEGFRRMVETNPDDATALTEEVLHFRHTLETLGVDNPLELEPPRVSPSIVLTNLAQMLIFAPFALIGALASWLPYRALRPISRKLAGSEFDLVSTLKAILGLVFMPLVYLVEALVIAWFGGWELGLLAAVILPSCGFIALRWAEWFDLRRDVMRGYLLRITNRPLIERAIEGRLALAARIESALSEYGR